jgi:branched-chain amino acid transport system permease protein
MALEVFLRVLIMGLTIGAIYALIAIGLNLLWGTMRLLNISHGDLIMLGGFTAFWFFTLFGVSPLLSCLIAAIGCAVLGLITYKILFANSLRRVKSLESLEANSLLIFFGLLITIENLAFLLWGADLRGYSYLRDSVSVLGIPLALNRLSASLIAIFVCLGFYVFLQKTLFGKAVRAIIQDKDAAQVVGVNISSIYIFCFATGFAMAGLAGALISMFYTVTPFMGLHYGLLAFIVVILGGLGNILGSLIGGLLLGVITTAGAALSTPGYTYIIQYMLFIIIILFMPRGIFGGRVR